MPLIHSTLALCLWAEQCESCFLSKWASTPAISACQLINQCYNWKDDALRCWNQVIEYCLLQGLSTAVVQTAVPGAKWLLDFLLTNSIYPWVFGKFSHPSSFQTAVITDHCENRFIYPRLLKDLKRMHFKGRKTGCSASEQRRMCSQIKLALLLYASKETDSCLPFQMFCSNSKGKYKTERISVKLESLELS